MSRYVPKPEPQPLSWEDWLFAWLLVTAVLITGWSIYAVWWLSRQGIVHGGFP